MVFRLFGVRRDRPVIDTPKYVNNLMFDHALIEFRAVIDCTENLELAEKSHLLSKPTTSRNGDVLPGLRVTATRIGPQAA